MKASTAKLKKLSKVEFVPVTYLQDVSRRVGSSRLTVLFDIATFVVIVLGHVNVK